MASKLTNNFLYNIILTVSGYLFPFLTFPYVTRVLGPSGLGEANIVLSIIDYAVMLSTLGVGSIGVKEIAKCNADRNKLNEKFSELLSLHIIMMALISVIYFISVLSIPALRENLSLYVIGFCKIVFNVFLIEWFFSGLQNFKYITLRTIVTRLVYVVLIFVFVKSEVDILPYVLITIFQVILNAIINTNYAKRYVSYNFSLKNFCKNLKAVCSLGLNYILLSFYGTFITMYLGFACDAETVGIYTTSTKLYSILLSIISAFNGVLMPYLNSLYGRGNNKQVKELIEKSINLILFVSIPVIGFCFSLSPEIVRFIAGQGYEQAILPFQIVIFQILLVGLAQIFEPQILLTYDKIKEITIITAYTAIGSVVIMFLFGEQYGAIAAACAITIPHIFECLLLYMGSKKILDFSMPWRSVFTYSVLTLLIVSVLQLLRLLDIHYMLRLFISSFVTLLLYVIPLYIQKNSILGIIINKIKNITK